MKRLGMGFMLVVCMAALAFAMEDIKQVPSCAHCGMDREKFSHSRMMIEYDDGTMQGTCSIHCAALDLAINIGKTPSVITVGDFNTRNLIDAGQAHWVIGGDAPGVMTKRAKWAFEKKEAAEKFIQEHGGTLASFDDAMKASYEDMYQDTKMIRDKRKMMKMKESGVKHH